PPDALRVLADQALIDRRMLGIDGNDLAPRRACEFEKQLTGHDERFFIRECDPLRELHGFDRRPESRKPHERPDKDVVIATPGRFREPVFAGYDFACATGLPDGLCSLLIGECD